MYWKHSYTQYILPMYSHDIQRRIGIETLPMKRELMIWVQDLMGFLILNVYLIVFCVIFPIWDPISWSQHPALELNIAENFRHLWNTKNSNRRKTEKGIKWALWRWWGIYINLKFLWSLIDEFWKICLFMTHFSFLV